ncbi:LCP family protein [Streptomyces sp. NPDC002536]
MTDLTAGSPQRGGAGRRKRARAGRKGRRNRSQRIRRILLWAFLAVILVTGAGGWWIYHRFESNLRSVDLEEALGKDRPQKVSSGAVDILVLGSDSRSGANAGLAGGDTGGTARSDTAMVLHVPGDRTRATAVSIPRDTLVTRPECRRSDGSTLQSAQRVMFNSVYTEAGPACVVKTVEQMSGVRLDHYIELDFAGFEGLVDALGGVTVTIDRAIDDTSSGLHLPAGEHRLDGARALAFVRTRHGIGDGSDLGRIGLQQQFLIAVLAEVKRQDALGSPAKLYRLADAATKSLTTDTGLASLSALSDFARSMKRVDPGRMATVMLPVVPDRADPNRVVADEPAAGKLWSAVRDDKGISAASPPKGAIGKSAEGSIK